MIAWRLPFAYQYSTLLAKTTVGYLRVDLPERTSSSSALSSSDWPCNGADAATLAGTSGWKTGISPRSALTSFSISSLGLINIRTLPERTARFSFRYTTTLSHAISDFFDQ